MKIYIPQHLKQLEIIDTLSKMILEYGKYWSGEMNSFSDFYSYLKKDPVQKFLSSCLNTATLAPGQDPEVVLTYITKLFYSVKGTSKVFDYMKKYLGLNISGDIIYNPELTEIVISSIELDDESTFIESFQEFLKALLIFKDIQISIPEINLVLQDSINSTVGGQAVTYKVTLSRVFSLD